MITEADDESSDPVAVDEVLGGDDVTLHYELLTRSLRDPRVAALVTLSATARFGQGAETPDLDWETIRRRVRRGVRVRRFVEAFATAPSGKIGRALLAAVLLFSGTSFALLLQDFWLFPQSETAARGTVFLAALAFAVTLLTALALSSSWSAAHLGVAVRRTVRIMGDWAPVVMTAAVLILFIAFIHRRTGALVEGLAKFNTVSLTTSLLPGTPTSLTVQTPPRSVTFSSSDPNASLNVCVLDGNNRKILCDEWKGVKNATFKDPIVTPLHVQITSSAKTDVTMKVFQATLLGQTSASMTPERGNARSN